MYSTEIFFKNLNDVKQFVTVTSKYDHLPINLVSGIYIIDAHSLIGIISLDISKPIKLEVQSDDIPESFYDDIKPFLSHNEETEKK